MDRYVVFGNPISHSKSPLIQRMFAEQTGKQLHYSTMLAPLENFTGCVNEFFRQGRGANITMPFKEHAYRLANRLTKRAQRTGAVNTLSKLVDGTLFGDNTDGVGLVRDLTVNAGFSLRGKHILLLGAGGAVRGVLEPLLAKQPTLLILANRTVEKAKLLVSLFNDINSVYACGFDSLLEPVDVIINATSVSMSEIVPPISGSLVKPGKTICYDMMYGKQSTAFCCWANKQGAAVVMDGLGMLVEQAAESFFFWHGVRPDTASVLAELR
ncbi:shikimate dehydrogenase [Candidatus Pseudomonas adelgestsugas]|uniref:Shikimate dehydrogenase (NADP(+)) n=1 Tax=Candidatus Pseudomonas adelgestsugas TaxID=1302376 RepID=A0ABX5RAW4_9PSED|nr:shikimate dehydrogenase [Candidatus Pseudomonas adelgestsugas]QAX82303.1 Shikimate dehydrogenase [Candidatus Pseudomonas adelgestsugas]